MATKASFSWPSRPSEDPDNWAWVPRAGFPEGQYVLRSSLEVWEKGDSKGHGKTKGAGKECPGKSRQKGASPASTKGASPANAKGASPANAKGASPARVKGASAAGAKGASPASAKGASHAGAKGASPANARGASPASAKGASPASANGEHHLPVQREERHLPAQREEHHLPAQRRKHHLPVQREEHHLPAQRRKHHLPVQRGEHHLPAQRGEHHLPAQRGEHHLPAQRGEHHLPAKENRKAQTEERKGPAKALQEVRLQEKETVRRTSFPWLLLKEASRTKVQAKPKERVGAKPKVPRVGARPLKQQLAKAGLSCIYGCCMYTYTTTCIWLACFRIFCALKARRVREKLERLSPQGIQAPWRTRALEARLPSLGRMDRVIVARAKPANLPERKAAKKTCPKVRESTEALKEKVLLLKRLRVASERTRMLGCVIHSHTYVVASRVYSCV